MKERGSFFREARVALGDASGLELARQFDPDVVLCDIGFPGDLDGYAVARAFHAGFDLHLVKPVDAFVLERSLGLSAGPASGWPARPSFPRRSGVRRGGENHVRSVDSLGCVLEYYPLWCCLSAPTPLRRNPRPGCWANYRMTLQIVTDPLAGLLVVRCRDFDACLACPHGQVFDLGAGAGELIGPVLRPADARVAQRPVHLDLGDHARPCTWHRQRRKDTQH